MTIFLAVIIILLLLLLGLPVAYAFLIGSVVILVGHGFPLEWISLQPFYAIDSFPLMAIPFFVLAGRLMQDGGISNRIFHFIHFFIGRLRGGLGATAVAACMFFGALTGSSVATVSAIGSLMIPEMEKGGYTRAYAAALISAAGFLGVLIPPSIPGILYGMMAEISIARVFLTTVGPGILLGALYILVNYVIFGRKQPKVTEKQTWSEFATGFSASFRQGFLALLMPVIILGGIYGGIFTPTEAAAVAVVYGFLVAFLVYRTVSLKDLYSILMNSTITSSVLLIIVALAAGIGGRVFTILQIPDVVSAWCINFTTSPLVMLLMVNVFLLLLGMFLDCNTIVLIFTPVFMEMTKKYGIDPYHFGAIMLMNVEIGLITPPAAANLFVGCMVSGLTIDKIWKPLIPFLLVCFPVLILVTLFPQISLFIPNLIMGK
ncbi:MAG: TRAP transporter large permease [Proteobacteria bacterium]|nr:TRAP transporter large permease [Pseudomonadota bacterium]